MRQSEQVPCAGSASSEPHTARVPAAYSVIRPGGTVVYCCDVACLERVLHARAGDVRGTACGWRPAQGRSGGRSHLWSGGLGPAGRGRSRRTAGQEPVKALGRALGQPSDDHDRARANIKLGRRPRRRVIAPESGTPQPPERLPRFTWRPATIPSLTASPPVTPITPSRPRPVVSSPMGVPRSP